MSDETKVPAIPAVTPSNLNEVARALKAILDVREGRLGNPLDANVTFRDLVDAGALVTKPGFNGRSGTPVMPPWAEPDGYDPTADLLPPPRPEGVQVTGGFALITIQFNDPGYRNHAYAEIWRATTNVIGSAVRIGTTDTRFYTDSVGSSAIFYYWVRFVSKANVIGPYNATDGIQGQTANNPALVLASLTGQITESQLFSSLATRISLIDAPASTPGSVNARLAVVQSQVNDLLSTPTYNAGSTYQKDALVNYNGAIYQAKQVTTGNLPTDTTYWTKIGDYSSLGGAVAAQASQISTLTSDLAAEVSARTSLASAVNHPTTGLAATRATLVNDYYTKTAIDSAISSATTALSSSINSTLTGYVTNSTLTTNYYTRSATDSAISQATTELGSSITNTLTGYVTSASLTQNYYTKTQTDSAISAATSSLVSTTALNTALASYTNTASLTQNYYTKTQTDSAISSATSSLVSTTALTNTLGSYVTNASLTANHYTKTQTDSAISSATSTLVSTTALNNALGNYTTTAALQQNYYTRTATDSAISSATSTLVSTTALNNALGNYTTTVALQQAYYTRASAAGLEAQYTVKIDSNGRVSGFGLASTTVSGTPTSAFIIRADKFAIADPASTATSLTNTPPDTLIPFIVSGGSVFIKSAFIQDGTITNAKIANLAVDNAKIASLDATKITTGFLSADRIQAGALDAKIANISAAVITSGTIGAARIADASITGAKIANATITDANIASLNASKINAGKITAAYIDGTNLNINAAGVELGMDVGPGTGHYGLSLSDSNFNNIFIRRSDGVVFFRVNEGGANSLTFDSSTGVLNIKGVISASQVAVGSATGATTFFDPAQPAVPLNSSASGFLAYSGPGLVLIYVPQTCTGWDPKYGTYEYDCSYYVTSPLWVTSPALEFLTNNASIDIGRRIRTGNVRFTITAAGTVDQFLSIWYRIRNANGTYGNWVSVAMATEPQRNYGSSSVSANISLFIGLGQGVQFSMATVDMNGNFWNTGMSDLYDGTISVTGVNF